MLVECGYTRATTSDGREWTFAPSLGRIAALGDPREIVEHFADLHDEERAERAASYVLAVLCEQDDTTPLIGEPVATPAGIRWQTGLMPAAEKVIVALHLMRHGMVGKARPGGKGSQQGSYCDRFDAGEYIAAARVHLGLSSADAEALSMTELQQMLEMKFPEAASDTGPSRDEYEAAMAAADAIMKAKGRSNG